MAVEAIIVNQGDEAETISTMLQMNVKDATGQSYGVDLSAAMALGVDSPDGELSPGERLRGKAKSHAKKRVQAERALADWSTWLELDGPRIAAE